MSTSFLRTNEIFRERWCRSEKKKNDGRMTWIVQRNEKISFFKTNKRKTNDLKPFQRS